MDIIKNQIINNKLGHCYIINTNNPALGHEKIKSVVDYLSINSEDIISLDQLDNIKISEIRYLQKQVNFKPYSSKYKIIIIERADNLTPEAANAILKTLEEPPKDAIFFLISSNLANILPTIISRSQIIRINDIKVNQNKISLETEEKMSNIRNMKIYERFALINTLIKNDDKDEINKMLLTWLQYFHQDIINQAKSRAMIKKINQTVQYLSSTNVNKKLLLENLIINI